jgi:glycosyltransferase involved in cell wall biosynthesis
VYKKFNRVPLISISNNQRLPVKDANWVKTIYHGLPTNLYQCGPGSGNYLAFIGRISPEKRVDRAIEIAKKTGIPLRIAAKIDKADEEYFETQIRHLFDDPIVDYVGEIGEHEKEDFLGNALGMLFPIDWPEPFGLVMIESMACGTPVIAYAGGSVPEVIENGITGFIANSIEESVSAVNRIHTIDRRECRKRFEQRFSSPVMALNYVSTYQMLIEKNNNRLMRKLGTFQ